MKLVEEESQHHWKAVKQNYQHLGIDILTEIFSVGDGKDSNNKLILTHKSSNQNRITVTE